MSQQTKYLVWVKDRDSTPECYSVGKQWVPNGEGPLTRLQADRIARETGGMVRTRVLECGLTPIDLYGDQR